MTEDYVTRFANEKLTIEEVKQAINYVIKNEDSAIIYSSLTEEEYEEKYNDDCEYSEITEIELFSKEFIDDFDEDEEQVTILQVGLLGEYINITAEDVVDKSLTDCVIDLISDVVVKDKRKRATKKKKGA